MSNKLKSFLYGLLKEDNPAELPKNWQDVAAVEAPVDVSLDQVVDRYLIRYERESIPNSDAYSNEMFDESSDYTKVLEFVLREAPEDEELDLGDEEGDALPADDELDAAPEDAPMDDTGTDEPAAADAEAPVQQTPQINLQTFSRNIARMVNNYETLLNPKNIILNRVNAYMQSNYDDRTAKELMDILDQNYSLRPFKNETEESEQQYPEPYAAGALSSDG